MTTLKLFSIAIMASAQVVAFGQQIAALDAPSAVPVSIAAGGISSAKPMITNSDWESKLSRWSISRTPRLARATGASSPQAIYGSSTMHRSAPSWMGD